MPNKLIQHFHEMTSGTNCALDSFEIEPGETLEQSLTRAITLHIQGYSFSTILRTVNRKRLEAALVDMEFTESQADNIMRLLGLARLQKPDNVRPFQFNFLKALQRTTIERTLSTSLSPEQFLAVKAYEKLMILPLVDAHVH